MADKKIKKHRFHKVTILLTLLAAGCVLAMGVGLLYKRYNCCSSEANDRKERSSEEKESKQDTKGYHTLAGEQLLKKNLEKTLSYMAGGPHLAGTPQSKEKADWLHDKFVEFGLDRVHIKKYNVLLSYPGSPANISMSDENDKELFSFSPTEAIYNDAENDSKIVAPYCAYSKSGTFEGELVYVNHGTESDYQKLESKGVTIKDKIVLVRYGAIARQIKIKMAENKHAKGMLLFSDPEDYSPTGKSYPDTWYMPLDSIQRGTLLRMKGDPLTPGYPSIDGYFRREIDLESAKGFPSIPVQPISGNDAIRLLKELDGFQIKDSKFKGKLPNVTYGSTSKKKKKIKLQLDITKETRPIYNVIGVLEGSVEPDRLVMIGNHRDAWTFGASDPSGGTAVLTEVARALGWLRGQGWRPRRTILFCSWDAEEFGLMGSTEWVEENAKILSQQGVAYLNIDLAVEGNHTIRLKTTPVLADSFFKITKQFVDPATQKSLYESWLDKTGDTEPDYDIFRSGSDYMPFYANQGICSLDARYTFNSKEQGVFLYPTYHTRHDNLDWLKRFVDPDMSYHLVMAKIFMQLTLLIADEPILPFNLKRYSQELDLVSKDVATAVKSLGPGKGVSAGLLKDATSQLKEATAKFHRRLKTIDVSDALAVRRVNDQLMYFERNFVTTEDSPSLSKTKHLFHSPGIQVTLDAVMNEVPGALDKLRMKITMLIYHMEMAVKTIESPFANL